MLRQTNDTKHGFASIQFKDSTYRLGVVDVDDIFGQDIMDAESIDEFKDFFKRRDERTSYCCDNCYTIGIIRDPSSVDMQTLNYKTNTRYNEMNIYAIYDKSEDKYIVFYTEGWVGINNPRFYKL